MHELLWRIISTGSYRRRCEHGFTNQSCRPGRSHCSGSQDDHLALRVSVCPFKSGTFGICLVNSEG
ncbi:uncharacterized protein METZ01_LOCUS12057 [marine metagenome]|uniref:Uncharacterized protein n=1 Tax=marine metagenome TaxID=408172 RepID=A0A381P0J4_9ZZZZ